MTENIGFGKMSMRLWIKIFVTIISLGLITLSGIILGQNKNISENRIIVKQLDVKLTDHIRGSGLIDREKTIRLEEKIEAVQREQKIQYDNVKEQLNRILHSLKTLETKRRKE